MPQRNTDYDELNFWQERILRNLLLVAVALGWAVYLPSVALSVKEGLYDIAVIDTLIYLCALFLFFYPGVSYTVTALIFCGMSYALGMVLLFVLGPFGAGPVWLFAFPVLVALFIGLHSSIAALFINGITIAGVGLLAHHGFLEWGNQAVNPVQKWIVTSLNFMLLNIIVVASVTALLKGLYQSLETVARSQKKYRQIFENLQDVYFEAVLDENRLTEVSPSVEKITGYTRKEILNTPTSFFYKNPEERKILVEQLLKSSTINDFNVTVKDKNDCVKIFSINAGLIFNRETNTKIITGMLRDVTLQKAMEKKNLELQTRLDRARKMEALGLLAGGVAHDLNNILSAIVGYPEVLLMDLEDDSPLKLPLETIKSSGHKAAEIVQDLLTLSRRGITTRNVVNLNDLVRDFLNTPEYGKILEYNPLSTIKADITADQPHIKGSGVHLSKTIMNLVSNAAEAQKNGGEIRISTENIVLDQPVNGYTRIAPGQYVTLKVADQGTGIDTADIERIFEPFFTKKVMGRSGTGLGMAVVWGTVQDHEGYVDIKTIPGSGTTFILYFPVTGKEINKPVQTLSYADYNGNGEHILVVDDVTEQRNMAKVILEKFNYTVSPVKSGEEALSFLENNSVDLVLLDMIMDPGMDGLDTYKQILSLKPGQKALIVSGFSETDRVQQALDLGASQYIKKPYNLKAMGRAVKKALDRI